jgi:putative ATPase
LYWLCRMLEGGCDPIYIARRVVRMASEEIGNADPRALQLAMDAWDVMQRLGSPEGELALAQAVTYLALAPKSNAVYSAYNQMRALIKEQPDYDVPIHLRNAPTELMKDIGFGGEYRYAHDEPNAYAAGENYLPEGIQNLEIYQPVDRGLEKKMSEKLKWLNEQDKVSTVRRYK